MAVSVKPVKPVDLQSTHNSKNSEMEIEEDFVRLIEKIKRYKARQKESEVRSRLNESFKRTEEGLFWFQSTLDLTD